MATVAGRTYAIRCIFKDSATAPRHQVLGMYSAIHVQTASAGPSTALEQSLGVLHSLAGSSPLGVLQVNLLPGRTYMIECAFDDGPKAKPHFMLGMSGSFRVSGRTSAR